MIKILKNYFRFGSCKSFSARSISHRVRRSRHSVAGAMTTADDGKFCLADYDAIGFDMDHTLAKYKLVNLLNVRMLSYFIAFIVCSMIYFFQLSVSLLKFSIVFKKKFKRYTY